MNALFYSYLYKLYGVYGISNFIFVEGRTLCCYTLAFSHLALYSDLLFMARGVAGGLQ